MKILNLIFTKIPIGKSALLTALFLTLSACSHLRKDSHFEKTFRSAASVSPYQYRPVKNTGKKPAILTKEKLLRRLKEGSATADKAIFLNRERKPFCSLDINGKEELLPGFIKPAPPSFRSSVSFKPHFPSCSNREERRLSVLSQNFVPPGAQVAALPAVLIGGVSGISGCVIAIVAGGSTEVGVVGSGLVGGLIGLADDVMEAVQKRKDGIYPRGYLWGTGLGVVGYLVCDAVIYLIEDRGDAPSDNAEYPYP